MQGPTLKDQTHSVTDPTKNEGNLGDLRYKDQVRSVGAQPVALADAVLVTESQVSNPPPSHDEIEKRIRENLRSEMQQLHAQQKENDSTVGCQMKRSTCMMLAIVATMVLTAASVVGGLCGTGRCGKTTPDSLTTNSAETDSSPTLPNEPFPVSTPPTIRTAQPTVMKPFRPSLSPTLAPVAKPTLRPTTRADSIVDYINSITLSGMPLQFSTDSKIPEEQALAWLIDQDTTDSTDRLQQRYALATFWIATQGSASRGWLSALDECTFWEGIRQCNSDGDVTQLILSGSNLQGSVPKDLGLLTALSWLQLDLNRLTGTVPSELSNLTALTTLNLALNQLTGTIPTSLGLLANLEMFHVDGNSLAGDIPTELTSWTRLRGAFVFNNNFAGTMPLCGVPSVQQIVADCNTVSCPCCSSCCPVAMNGIPQHFATCSGCQCRSAK